MQILAAYKAILMLPPAIVPVIYIARVDQGSNRPSIVLECPESGQEYSHSGPSGLFDAHIKITARADTADKASEIGDAVVKRLQSWRGTSKKCVIQLTEHFSTSIDYDEKAKVAMQIEEFTAHFTRTD